MKKHEILFQQLGENATSPKDPVEVWTQQVNLQEEIACCRTSDDDGLVMVPKYAVKEVWLPDWLSPEEWLKDTTKWKYLWGLGVNREWPESWQRGLAEEFRSDHGASARIFAASKLLNQTRFKSEFRKSLRDQLVAWLESSERKHASALSPRQWDMLTKYDWLEAKRHAEQLYWRRGELFVHAPE
jgi:hypothetical protein